MMKALFLTVLASVVVAPTQPVMAPVATVRTATPLAVTMSDWYVSSQVADTCKLQASGIAIDAAGADLEVNCAASSKVMGNVSAQIAAQSWRQRRVTVSAEIKVDAAMHASLWLKTQRGTTPLMFDDDSEQILLSTTQTVDGWQRRIITLPVAADATQIGFGVLLQGEGALAVRNLQLHVSQPGAISAEATQMLDTALTIVKLQTQDRDDLSWQVLEPQLRVFASGAQSAAEVYPAIKYLLSRLGDARSLLLTADAAQALNRVSAVVTQSAAHDVDSRIDIFTLPDGARLVLSRASNAQPLRTARNQTPSEALP